MHIIGLEVENYGRIKAVSIEPDATGAVIISGRNAQGKTSLMNAIWAALGGRAGNNASKPVREGAEQAKVTVDLGDMIVTRVWRGDNTNLEVRSKEGAVYKSPQALLDGFIGKLSFDPLAFTRLKERDQKDALLQLVELDIDLDALQAERDQAFSERTATGQERKRLGEVVVDKDLPVEERSATDLIGQLRTIEEQRTDRAHFEQEALYAASNAERAKEEIARLTEGMNRYLAKADECQAKVAAMPAPADPAPIEAELEQIDATNAAIRANNANRLLAGRAEELDKRRDELTATIDKLDKDKAEALARAAFPVPGLGFDSDGVTFNEVPFSQASSAEQIRVSMAMAIAGNPKLRVVRVMDGSLLDDEGMQIITELAAENEFQVWIERVANGDGVGFLIEDGELADGAAVGA